MPAPDPRGRDAIPPSPEFPYALAVHRVRVGTESYDLLGLRDFEETVTALAEHVGRGGDPRWFETWCPMFGVVWPSARALAAEIQRHPDLAGRTVLELGCGLALPSIAAARRGAVVYATDRHPHAERFLAENLARNGVRVRFAAVDWDGAPAPGAPDTFDRVLASDVLYDPDQPEALARALDRWVAPGGVAWVTDPGRPWLDAFASAARERGFAVEVDVVGVDGPDVSGAEAADAVFLLELVRAAAPGEPR